MSGQPTAAPSQELQPAMDDIRKQEPITLFVEFDTNERDGKFLKSVEAVRQIAGDDIAYRQKGSSGRIMQFPTYFQFAMFNVHVWEGTAKEGPSEFVCEFSHGLNPYWMKAAKGFLRTIGVRYKLDIDEPEVTFHFEKFAWRAAFQSAVEDGTIDRMTTALWQADLIQGKLRLRNFDKRPKLAVIF